MSALSLKLRTFAKNILEMRKPHCLLLVGAALLSLTGCDRKDAFILRGSVEGLLSDTIRVCYQHPDYRLDTIIAQEGTFTYTFIPDTFTVFYLTGVAEEALPILADKRGKVRISGTTKQIRMEGDPENEKLAGIRRLLAERGTSRNSLLQAVDSLVQSDPRSYVNLYLIDKYYVQDTLPDYEHIRQIVKGLSGNIKDTPYMTDLQEKLEERPHGQGNRLVSNLSCKDQYGKAVNWNRLRDKYVLLSFWASWDSLSVAAQDSLVPVQKALKKEKFVILSLSLDLDRKAWQDACQKDTTQWIQVCDFKGWGNTLVKQQDIRRLPASLLIGPDKRVIAENLPGQELIDKVKERLKQDKEKERAAKEAEKTRKRQNKNKK